MNLPPVTIMELGWKIKLTYWTHFAIALSGILEFIARSFVSIISSYDYIIMRAVNEHLLNIYIIYYRLSFQYFACVIMIINHSVAWLAVLLVHKMGKSFSKYIFKPKLFLFCQFFSKLPTLSSTAMLPFKNYYDCFLFFEHLYFDFT